MSTGSGSLLLAWLRIDLRRRRRALLVLALLVALSAGTVLAAVAGARRGASALDRLLEVTLPATAVVSPFQPGFDWAAVRALPEVAALTTFAYYSDYRIDELPGYPPSPPYIPADAETMAAIERPVVLAGRLADPGRDDEVVITPAFARARGLDVGARLTLRLYTPQQIDDGLLGEMTAPPAGPAVAARVVGVVRSPYLGDEPGSPGQLIPSPGLVAAHPANLRGASGQAPINALVRLRGGDADLPAFTADLARVSGRPDVDVLARTFSVQHGRDVLGFESASLLVFAAAAAIVALVLVGQATGRFVAAGAADLAPLGASGMTPGQSTLLAVAGPALAAVAGTGVGIAGAVAASAAMPFGTAALYEPAPGVDVDAVVLGTGAVAGPLLVLAFAVGVARWGRLRRGAPARSAVVAAAARWGTPVPVLLGMRFALDRGRAGSPSRPALLGSVAGVLGVVAAATLSAGIADTVTHPQRFGQTHQLLVVFGFGGFDLAPVPPLLTAIRADPDVTGLDDMHLAAADVRGTSVPTFSFDPDGGLPLVLVDGRAPATAGEVVLAPTAARRLGAEVGSTVPLAGDAGARDLRVAGIGFVPDNLYNSYDNGAWVTGEAYASLFHGFKQHGALLVLRAGADPGAVAGRLVAGAAAAGTPDLLVTPPDPPRQLTEIHTVQVLPVLLGGFLALLAVGATGYALAAAVRRRGRDLAVLRALGMTPRQAGAAVLTQAAVLAAVGLLAGVPLGLALGRTLWRVIADITPLAFVAPDAATAVLVLVPATLVVAALLAAGPGHRIARQRLGPALRAE